MKATIASIVLRRLPSHLQFMEMPLKTKILEPQNINEATIITILNNGALEHHDNNREEYAKRNKLVLDRYTIKNTQMIDLYDKLIENLYDGQHQLSHEYDWKTNLYK